MRIAADQPLALARPLGFDVAPARPLLGPDFENVGKVGPNQQLEVEAYRRCTVVPDIDVFVKSLADHSAEHESQGPRRDDPMVGYDPRVHEAGARGIVRHGARVQQGPRLAVDIELIAADIARVTCIEALV